MKQPGALKGILKSLGTLIPVVGVMALLSLIVAFWFGEYYAVYPLAITAGVSFSLGFALWYPTRKSRYTPDLGASMIIAASGWLIVAAVGSLPFILIAYKLSGDPKIPETILYFRDPLNAFFESVAGFTGTGLTMTLREDLLPKSLQWWRSFTQWIGGVGVIVLTLSVLFRPGGAPFALYLSEGREEKIQPSVVSTVRTIWWIFGLYTLVSVILFRFAGMPLWHAINHAMTGISTGGFSVTDESIATYGSPMMEAAVIPVMLFGAISFAVHYELLLGKPRHLIRDLQTSRLLILLVGGSLILIAANYLTMPLLGSVRDSTFQFFSGVSCTGFQTSPIEDWGASAQLVMVIGMIVGGAAGSTAGGIKLIRAIVVLKGVWWTLKRLVASPYAVLQFKLGRDAISREEAESRFQYAASLLLLWIVFLFMGVLLLDLTASDNFSLSQVLFEVASAQSNVGLTAGITGPEMSAWNKVILCFNMWIGRLEIIPVLFLLRSFFRGVSS